MQKIRKRKHVELRSSSSSKPTTVFEESTKEEPFPTFPRPTPDECKAVRDDLLALHGFPQQFAKYRDQRLKPLDAQPFLAADDAADPPNVDDGLGAEESVLDGLVKTVLSQNTTDANCQKAFSSLKSAYPNWEDVLAAESKCIENAIRCGGLAPTKASCIKNILNCLLEKRGKLCLEYLRDLSIDEIKAELSRFKGIGPKTVACVLMFNLQLDDFPVDTHVFEIGKTMGWLPPAADRNKAYVHLNHRIPDELKFDLNCLLFTHGKLCRKCTKKGGNAQRKGFQDNPCPLLKYSRDSNMEKPNTTS